MSDHETPSAIDAMVDENMNLRDELDEKDDLLDAATRRADEAEDALERSSRRLGFADGSPVAAAQQAGGATTLTDVEPDESVEPETSAELGEPSSNGSVSDELATVIAERDSYLADSQRLAADFANYRKQSEKRIADTAATQSAGLVRDLISVLDACDSALTQDPDSAVGPIRAALLGELVRHGLELVAPEAGEGFDPERHEAVMHEMSPEADSGSDGAELPVQRIAELFRAGYAWKGRVVRPAMVKVVG